MQTKVLTKSINNPPHKLHQNNQANFLLNKIAPNKDILLHDKMHKISYNRNFIDDVDIVKNLSKKAKP